MPNCTSTELIQHTLLFVHILSGCLALVFGILILCLKKGNRTHRRNGKIFFFSMIAISISALVLSATKHISILHRIVFGLHEYGQMEFYKEKKTYFNKRRLDVVVLGHYKRRYYVTFRKPYSFCFWMY